MVQPVQGKDIPGADFALELALGGLDKSFDQSAGRRITHAAVEQADV
jgi:hypothetical protein